MEPSTNEGKRTSIRDVLFILFDKNHVFFGTLITVVALVIGISLLVGPIYQVSSTILIRPFIDSTVQYQIPPGNVRFTPVSQENINSEIEIIKSESLLREIVLEHRLYAPKQPQKLLPRLIFYSKQYAKKMLVDWGISKEVDPVDVAVQDLIERLGVESIVLSNTIRLTLSGDDPAQITKILNSIIDRYIDKHIDVYQVKGSMEFFSRQAELYYNKLTQSEEELKKFQQTMGINDLEIQKENNAKTLDILQEKLATVRSGIAEHKTKYEKLEKSMRETGNISAKTEEFLNSPVITELTKSLVILLMEREHVAQLYPLSSPEYQDISRRINQINARIKEELRLILHGTKLEIESLLSQEEGLLKEIETTKRDSDGLADKEIGLNTLIRAVKQNQKNYLLYTDKTEEARIENQKEIARVSNVSVASWPQQPSIPVFPKKTLLVALALGVGLIGGVGASFSSYYLDTRIKRPVDVLQNCEVPLLMSFGLVKKQRTSNKSVPIASNGKRSLASSGSMFNGADTAGQSAVLQREKENGTEGRNLADLVGIEPSDDLDSQPGRITSGYVASVRAFEVKGNGDRLGEAGKNINERWGGLESQETEYASFQLPSIPTNGKNSVPFLWLWDPTYYPHVLEDFRSLKNQIVRKNQKEDCKVFLFTGAEKGVGSSAIAFNLALALAWDLPDKKTLLFDANLKEPRLHDAFGIEATPGLLDFMAGGKDISEVIHSTFWPNLDLFTKGAGEEWMVSPFDLEEFGFALNQIRNNYHFVVIDSAPILRCSQTRTLSAKADAVIIVAEENQTRCELILKVKTLLDQEGACCLGGILNKRRLVIPQFLYRMT